MDTISEISDLIREFEVRYQKAAAIIRANRPFGTFLYVQFPSYAGVNSLGITFYGLQLVLDESIEGTTVAINGDPE